MSIYGRIELTVDVIPIAEEGFLEIAQRKTIDLALKCRLFDGPLAIRGAAVDPDGLTWWERRIKELEAGDRF